MALPSKSFATLVQDIAAGIQGRASDLIDFTVGSPLRAIAEGVSSILLWMQSLILRVLAATRAATSTGSDLDTWMADFGLTRIAAVAATGNVTFARFTASTSAPFIPVGAQLRTSDGSQTYTVIADTTNSAYSATLGGYTLASGVTSVSVLVQADTAGAAGNVSAGAITQMLTPVPGVDTVSNPSPLASGADAESDAAFRTRFQAYILGLSRGDLYGVEYALSAMQVGLQYEIIEGQDPGGATDYGFFFIVADDGSGSPSSTFLNNVYAAVNAVRPLGIRFGVIGPTLVTANWAMTVTVASGYTASSVQSAVQTTIAAKINALGLGAGLPITQLASWAYAVPGVASVSAMTINGVSGDAGSIAASVRATIKAGTGTVTTA